MKKEYQALRDVVIEKVKRKEFMILNYNCKYTTTIRLFDDEQHYDIVFWMSNGVGSFKTYDGSDISLIFEENTKEELYNIIKSGDGNIKHVSIDRHSNDLSFKVDGAHLFSGYDDGNWWDNVSPAIFKKHNIKNIDGVHYQFN